MNLSLPPSLDSLLLSYIEGKGVSMVSATPLDSGGSGRKYRRVKLSDGTALIATYGETGTENKAFMELAAAFAAHNLPVPAIISRSEDQKSYLQSDMGEMCLLDVLKADRVRGMALAAEILSLLPEFQVIPEAEWEGKVFNARFSWCQVLADLHYFKHCFLKGCNIDSDDEKLEEEFYSLSTEVGELCEECQGLILRDFQSRNIMVNAEGRCGVIDFQGARKGPMTYDLASFLWQSRAGFTKEERQALAEVYFHKMEALLGEDKVRIMKSMLPAVVLVRMLQTLGAYGYRGLMQKKAQFTTVIPTALKELKLLLADGRESGCPEGWEVPPTVRCPELCKAVEKACEVLLPQFAIPADGRLRVKVFSFSYKKGYPADYSGNGGGYMFDCRALPNPGRYEEYKRLTGKDRPVEEFLEKCEEVEVFIREAHALVRHSVEVYLSRGFTSLQAGFGCTGGRHRSVYCAERLARMLAREYPEAEVRIVHREQGVDETVIGSEE